MSTVRNVYLMTPSLVPYDAIGNDVAAMRAALVEQGFAVQVFAQGVHPACAAIAEPLARASASIWDSPDAVLIYHHSAGWPQGEAILFRTRNRVVIRYHNVTPPRFFAPYSEAHRVACQAGVESTRRIATLPHTLVVGDSHFNCADFTGAGVAPARCRVLPPLHQTDALGAEAADWATVARFSGETVNLLFVGGVKPNKGHARAIHVLAQYQRHFNPRARLIFAGGLDERMNGYVDSLKQTAAGLGVADDVIFTGSVTGSQIKSLYLSADVFLCTSEHEGFCVPLLEAMYFRVPIVAWGVTAVPETMGDCGVVLEEWNDYLFAAHIDRLVEDDEAARRVGAGGRKRYEHVFAPGVLRRRLHEIVAEVSE